MVYTWKTGSCIKADANKAGKQFEKLEKTVGITAQTVLDANRSAKAPLHDEFEWQDDIAAELYRLKQSGHIIRCLCTVVETEDKQEEQVRVYMKTVYSEPYENINVICRDKDKREAMLATALKELQAVLKKYDMLKELQPVKDEISKITA